MYQDTTEREKVLKKIRSALANKGDKVMPDIDFTSEIYNLKTEDQDVQFAEALIEVKGEFVFCESEEDFLFQINAKLEKEKWEHIFAWEPKLQTLLTSGNISYSKEDKKFINMEVGITFCESLVARTGSVIFTSTQLAGRRLSIFPPIHVVVAYTSQLQSDIVDGLKEIRQNYGKKLPSMISLTTGPSRTADIEKTLVLGAHGPKELIVFLIDEPQNHSN